MKAQNFFYLLLLLVLSAFSFLLIGFIAKVIYKIVLFGWSLL